MRYSFIILILFLFIYFPKTLAQNPPSGFNDQLVLSSQKTFVGLYIDELDRIFSWEKSGKVWLVVNGVISPAPILDISNRVYGDSDLGLLGFTLDPNFQSNGFIYVCYTLKPNLVTGYYGGNPATYGIVSRFTTQNHLTNQPYVDPNSEYILLGNGNKGIPVLAAGHFGGALVFGDDGNLIVSTGDGAYFSNDDDGSHPASYYNEALNLGIIGTYENVGSNRSQMNNSISGKLLRINPSTGLGIDSNPFYDVNNPGSHASKVWTKGLRNPWSVLKIPNSGNHNFPGKFLVGDVGSGNAEEINYVHSPSLNFGWPNFEGMNSIHWLRSTFPGPSVWEKPIITLRGSIEGRINGNVYSVGSPELPGDNLGNNAAVILGDFANNINFPNGYESDFYFGDYASKNVYRVKFDSNMNPQYVKLFEITGKFIFGLKFSKVTGYMYYLSSNSAYGGNGEIRRVKYSPTNSAPIAQFEIKKSSGGMKYTTELDASYSYDPNLDALTYTWAFSDGQTATGLMPHITFNAPNTNFLEITATLTVRDVNNSTNSISKKICLNNYAPDILDINMSPVIPNSVISGQDYSSTFSANVVDENLGSLNYKWETFEMHNGHEHLVQTIIGNNQTVDLPHTSCEQPFASYWAKVKLTVTDVFGYTDVYEKIFTPNCGLANQNISFSPILDQNTSNKLINLAGTSSSNLPLSYYVISGLGLINNNILQLFDVPGEVIIRAAQNGNQTFNQATFIENKFKYTKSRTPQSISFNNITTQYEPLINITPVAMSNLGRNIKFLILNGPAYILNNQIVLTSNFGTVTVRAYNEGDDNTLGAFVDQSFNICPNSRGMNTTHHFFDDEVHIKSKNDISSNSVIESLAKIIYDTGGQINLLPGFLVNSGGIFETRLIGCGTN